MNKNHFKGGFTLIEVSIVLVIVGLLAGSILVGRDLIHAAEIHRQVKQIQEYQVAFNTFVAKYHCIPGDCPNVTDFFGAEDPAGNDIINGNGNGLIDNNMGYEFDRDPNTTWPDSFEMSGAVQQLGLANFIEFKPASTTTFRVGQDLPALRLNDKATFFIGANYNFFVSATGAPGAPPNNLISYKKGNNALWILACNFDLDPMGYWNDNCGIFTPADLQSVDLKVDDGKALSGNLLGFGGDTYFSTDHTDCLENAEYKVRNPTNECQAVFVIN